MNGEANILSIAIGPPKVKGDDSIMVEMIMNSTGKKIVCGDSTAKLFARILNKNIEVILPEFKSDVPPKAIIEGLDLVTEGFLTLSKVREIFDNIFLENTKNDLKNIDKNNLLYGTNNTVREVNQDSLQIIEQNYLETPAKELAFELYRADEIQFILGSAINIAHYNENISVCDLNKTKIINQIIEKLEKIGKKVQVKLI